MNERAANLKKTASKLIRKKSSLGVAAALVLALVTGAAWRLFGHSAPSAPQKTKTESEVKTVMHLDPFLVNLADADGDRFLRAGIELGLHKDLSEHEHAGQSPLPIARTRDTILLVLTACNADALLPLEGKAKLKRELTQALQEHVPELGVEEVYFTEFLVQR